MGEDPPQYVAPFTPDDVFRRFRYLTEQCLGYVGQANDTHPTWRLRVDHLVMLNVAQSALDDIWRFKVYHLRDAGKRSDAVKRAAYLTKWITRFRPIYFARILSSDDAEGRLDKKDTSLLINEGFAIHVSLTTIASEIGKDRIDLDPEFYANLLYDLHYRELSEDALLSLFDIIRTSARGDRIILRA